MPRVTFLYAENPNLGSIEVDSVKLRLGQPAELTDRQLARVRSIPGVRLGIETDSLDSLTRPQLNELAAEKRVEEPHKLPNKAAVIEAIRGVDDLTNEPEGDETDG